MSYNLNLSDTSFTNKDFQEIYPELLQLAKNLSYKWDPTVSNESDPGVTLIKEISLAMDKINYSSDKNALESMPLSVTQERTARQLFQLLGYYPKWYISSESTVQIAWRTDEGDPDNVRTIKFPSFTQIKDDSGDYVYTIPENILLTDDGLSHTYKAIQGFVKQLKINNNSLITFDLLDNNRRIYFPEYNVAQNGVFIIGKDAQESEEVNQRSFWEQKDNLSVQQTGNTYYSFNVDISSGRCYVEFPVDIADIIGSGLYIYYLVSNGKDGLIGIGQLNQLYDSSITATYVDDTSTIDINNDDLLIQNTDLEVTGKDPESIDDMYLNYNHTKGTFDTLVTLRDYYNAVYNTEMASNAVVSDRTNDIQKSYRIMNSSTNNVDSSIYVQEGGDGVLSPFDLKIYALQFNDLTETNSVEVNKSAYDNTFQMFTDLDVENQLNIDSALLQLANQIQDEKCVQHDFRDILPNKMCILKNIAEIYVTVFPTIALTSIQRENVLSDIRNAIYDKYNARKVNFGEEINYDDLFTVILTANNLIKNISLSQPTYYTYAMYYSDGEQYFDTYQLSNRWREVCVSENTDYLHISSGTDAGNIYYDNATGQAWFPNAKVNIDGSGEVLISQEFVGKTLYFINDYDQVFYLNEDNRVVYYSGKRSEFQTEIKAKNILAGISPLFTTSPSGFEYQLEEQDTEIPTAQNADITTEMHITSEGMQATYYPYDNEVVQLVRPLYNTLINYGAYVKYDYNGEDVPRNYVHELSAQETLVIYYKTEDDVNAPYVVNVYGEGYIIQPNFNLVKTTSNSLPQNSGQTTTPSTTLTCSAAQSIAILSVAEQVLSDTINYVYVIGQDTTESVDGVSNYKLVLNREGTSNNFSTTLQGSQQFICATNQFTNLQIFGSGTKITINVSQSDYTDDTYILQNRVVSLRNIQRFGVSALEGRWCKEQNKITILQQEFANIFGTRSSENPSTEDSYIRITSASESSVPNLLLDRDGLSYGNASASSQTFAETTSNTVVEYEDDNAVTTSVQIPIVDEDWLFANDGFMARYYYHIESDEEFTASFSKNVSLSPVDYEETTLYNVYIDGVPTSISGYKTAEFSINRDVAYYLISGATVYLIQQTQNGARVAQLNGYPSNLQTSVQLIKSGPVGGQYTYTSDSTLPPQSYLYLCNPSETIDKQVVNVSQPPNTSDASVEISFTDSRGDLDTYEAYVVDRYYEIQGVFLNYNTTASGAQQFIDPNSGSIADIPTGWENNYIALQCTEVVTNSTFMIPLRNGDNGIWEYDTTVNLSSLNRYWQFVDNNGSYQNIDDSIVRQRIYNVYGTALPNRYVDPWVWPIDDLSINIAMQREYYGVVAEGQTLYADSSEFIIHAKNQGGEEVDYPYPQWQVYGLVDLNLHPTQPSRIYDNQTLTINSGLDTEAEFTPGSEQSVYAFCSQQTYLEGYLPQSMQRIDQDGRIYYPQMLITTMNNQSSSGYSMDIYQNKILRITSPVSSETLQVNLPKISSYIFKIKNSKTITPDVSERGFVLTANNTKPIKVTCLNTDPFNSDLEYPQWDLSGDGWYYFLARGEVTSASDDTAVVLTFDIDTATVSNSYSDLTNDQIQMLNSTNPVQVDVYPMQSLDYSNSNQLYNDEVLGKIKELAQYNGKDVFNYFYQPPEDKLIENPLSADSFNNHNHFYNSYVICKIRANDRSKKNTIYINT